MLPFVSLEPVSLQKEVCCQRFHVLGWQLIKVDGLKALDLVAVVQQHWKKRVADGYVSLGDILFPNGLLSHSYRSAKYDPFSGL